MPSYVIRNVTIPNINTGSQNYTITVNVCYYSNGSCDYNDIKDTESISFTTPLTETILETASHNSEKPFTFSTIILFFSSP